MSRARWQRTRRVPGFERFFFVYLRWLLRRSFATVWLRRSATPLPRGGYVAAANHSSWWDGFVPYVLHRSLDPQHPFGVLMSDAELRRFPFFRWAGAFSIDASTPRAARASILYAGAQAESGAGVWIFPQGVLAWGATTGTFTSGFVHAARAAKAPIVPVALYFTMLDKQRAEAFVDVAEALDAERRDARMLTQRIVEERVSRIARDIDARSVDTRYRPLLRAAPGIDQRIAAVTAIVRRWC